MEKMKKCIVCKNEKTTTRNNEIKGIPTLQNGKLICQECSVEWNFCDICNKPYNKTKVNKDKFLMQYKSPITPIRKFPFTEGKNTNICSNECYNINEIDLDIDYLSLLFMEDLLYNDIMKVDKKFSKENLQNILKELEETRKGFAK